MKKQPKLPDKPSRLIRVALADLEKCERSRKYKIDMADWHIPNGKCSVCLAGAVMAQTFRARPSQYLTPSEVVSSDEDWGKLLAINAFREGRVSDGLSHMRQFSYMFRNTHVAQYATSPKLFKRDMRRLATMLAKEGL